MERMRVEEPAGGWRDPWPQVFEIANELPADRADPSPSHRLEALSASRRFDGRGVARVA